MLYFVYSTLDYRLNKQQTTRGTSASNLRETLREASSCTSSAPAVYGLPVSRYRKHVTQLTIHVAMYVYGGWESGKNRSRA